MPEFECVNCGACCFLAGLHPVHRQLGHATYEDLRCKHLDLDTKKCKIYETRPAFPCRVASYYPEDAWDWLRTHFCPRFHEAIFQKPIEPFGEGDCECKLPTTGVSVHAIHKPE